MLKTWKSANSWLYKHKYRSLARLQNETTKCRYFRAVIFEILSFESLSSGFTYGYCTGFRTAQERWQSNIPFRRFSHFNTMYSPSSHALILTEFIQFWKSYWSHNWDTYLCDVLLIKLSMPLFLGSKELR